MEEETQIIIRKALNKLVEYDGYWYNYSVLSYDIGIPVNTLKQIMKFAKLWGWVRYEYTINDEGQLSGMGYFINRRRMSGWIK